MPTPPEPSWIKSSKIFGFDCGFSIPIFPEQRSPHIPEIDTRYIFDQNMTSAILAGLAFNKKIYIHGLHGTGKSTHIEQVCARLNYPCMRINLDSFITRSELIGRDTIKIEDNKQIIGFSEGLLPKAISQNTCLVLDEFDSIKPELTFIMQHLLENNGKLNILETNTTLKPHALSRIFATANTAGNGDDTGIYSGTTEVNASQMDRWDIVIKSRYIPAHEEEKLIISKFPDINKNQKISISKGIVEFAKLTRDAFAAGDISVLMSTRTVISFCENLKIFQSLERSIEYSYINRLHSSDQEFANRLLHKCFGKAESKSSQNITYP